MSQINKNFNVPQTVGATYGERRRLNQELSPSLQRPAQDQSKNKAADSSQFDANADYKKSFRPHTEVPHKPAALQMVENGSRPITKRDVALLTLLENIIKS